MPGRPVQLALETTGRTGSVAVMRGEQVLQQANLDNSQRSAATLAPAIDRLANWCAASKHRIEIVSVADGPGSFTGLRIAVTTAKTLAYAWKLPLVAVNSLAAIAAATRFDHPRVERVLVALDAYRNQVFCETFTCHPAADPTQTQQVAGDGASVLDAGRWAERLAAEAQTPLAGDARPFGALAETRLTRTCDAIGVGVIALRQVACGEFVDPLELVPRYLKPSAAEEKLAQDT